MVIICQTSEDFEKDHVNVFDNQYDSLNEDETAIVFNELTKKNSVKNFDEYFETGAKMREEAAERLGLKK